MKKYLLRKDIMNLNLHQWNIIDDIGKNGMVEVTVQGFYELLGFTGGMFLSEEANNHEAEFIEEFYNYGRERVKCDDKIPLCNVSFAYDILKEWLQYVKGDQISPPIEKTEQWINKFEEN